MQFSKARQSKITSNSWLWGQFLVKFLISCANNLEKISKISYLTSGSSFMRSAPRNLVVLTIFFPRRIENRRILNCFLTVSREWMRGCEYYYVDVVQRTTLYLHVCRKSTKLAHLIQQSENENSRHDARRFASFHRPIWDRSHRQAPLLYTTTKQAARAAPADANWAQYSFICPTLDGSDAWKLIVYMAHQRWNLHFSYS